MARGFSFGMVALVAVAMTGGCGGGSKGGGSVGVQQPVQPVQYGTPWGTVQGSRDVVTRSGSDLQRLADNSQTRFGSVTQSTDGSSVSVTSSRRGHLRFTSSTGAIVDTANNVASAAVLAGSPSVAGYSRNGVLRK